MIDKDPFSNSPITVAQLKEAMIAQNLQDKMQNALLYGVSDLLSNRMHDLTLEPIQFGQKSLQAYSDNIGLGASLKL